ncbi:uncharacterized protein LOC127867513 [Dreissena polymorpha]|uniref:VWFC domain-containing protein n=1 Tax=Dreissena polymorpha TaxID=45954 RepID=A0A9D4RIC4_DREPO|nr:uncharacterized protein LOC127867513 [Dreissena polymorpha]KAH3867360.1 hypothetical protein DPMN_030487 [Dreissena polymorpha]
MRAFYLYLALALTNVGSHMAEAVMCYKCDHVAHPRDCDRIVECAANEVCHVISYAQPDGHFYYVTGCMAKTSCPASMAIGKRDIAICNRCCDGHYCNKELCDGPAPAGHGSRCLSCDSVEDPTHCGAVTECGQGQVCFTKEKYVFGELRYQLGCADPACAPRTYRDLLNKRAGLCQTCCSTENCNRDLCKNTGSPHTQSPHTVATAIPSTHGIATTSHTNVVATTFPYNLQGCHYKGKVYHQGQTWDEGCDFRCTCEDERTGRYVCQDICPTYINVPQGCTMQKTAGECCEHPVCHSGSTNFTTLNYTAAILITKCAYKNKTYEQDAKWRDGCDYECTCIDASRGYYRCTSLCYTWNLPQQCHLADPAPGKCCQTPSCPPQYTIKFPPGYIEN